MSFFLKRWRELLAAFHLLSILPVPQTRLVPQGRAVWAYPVAGLVIGGFGAGAYWLAYVIGLPGGVAAVAALIATVLVSGALHEDGLSDFFDGLGGNSPEKRLAIMRDSAQGVFGGLALMFSLAARGSAIVALGPAALIGLIATHMLARGSLCVPMYLFSPARVDGLTADAGKPNILAPLVLTALAAIMLLPVGLAMAVMAIAIIAATLTAWFASRRLGGITGDVLGACEQITEIAVLWSLLALR